MATVAAAAMATPFSRAWRSTSSPSIPMTTVVPAVSTDRPAVRIAVGVSARSTTSPPRLNVTPCPLAAVASCISAVVSLPGMCAPCTSNCTSPKPTPAPCPANHSTSTHPHVHPGTTPT
jgi:hypothetical protein